MEYPSSNDNTAPLIRFAYQIAPGLIVNSGALALGIFRVDTKYTVRGRRSNPISTPQKFGLMSAKEQAEMEKYVQERMRSKTSITPQEVCPANQMRPL